MIALLAALTVPVAAPAPKPQPTADLTPIRITMIGGPSYGSGDRVRVRVETADDGYLVVLRVDTDGHIRVLFPIDPDLDPFVRGGKTYELRGRADRQTFLADDHNGTGVIYAAVSREPMRFGDYALGDHWDYDALRLRDSSDDVESDLSRIVARMTDNSHFDYDIVNYGVTGPYIAAVGGAYPTSYGSYYNGGYDPYWDCLSCRWGDRPFNFGLSFGFGGYNPYYNPWGYAGYDPFFYDPYYYGYYNYPGSYWRYPGQSYPITVVNLPRPHIPTTPYGFRSRVRPTIPGLGGNLAGPGRSSSLGGGSSAGRAPVPTAGTYAGDRSRQPAVRPPTRNAEPPASASPPPRVDRTPPSSGGSSSGGSSGSTGSRSRPRPGGGGGFDATTTPVGQRVAPVTIDRSVDNMPRPIYRDPPRQQSTPQTTRDNPRVEVPRPVYREPPRMERSSPPPQTREAPRVERSSPPPAPVVRSSPPPPPPAPARTGGGSSSAPRSRPGGGGHR